MLPWLLHPNKDEQKFVMSLGFGNNVTMVTAS